MNLALYRKYRPQSFEEVHGQSAVRQTLMEALKQDRLVHAYLFAGPRGTGKTTTARLIARSIQCENRQADGQACGQCSPCQMNATGDLIDLIEIDAASNRGIDEIRELREKIRFAPTHAKAKVYIIDEVHMLTKEAFNALLKSLEEPPPHVYFILATTELHKIPETIISRCQRYDFKRISPKDIVERLTTIAKEENLKVEEEALMLLAEYADGGMRDAISLLEQFSTEGLTLDLARERLGLSHHQYTDALFGALAKHDTQAGLDVIDQLHKEGYQLQQFTVRFLGHLRAKLHEAVAGGQNPHVLLEWVDLFDEAWLKLKQASISQLPLEIAVIRACHQPASTTPAPAAQEKKPTASMPAPAPNKAKAGLSDLKSFQARWEDITAAIANVALRQSLRTANLSRFENNTLTLLFDSQFHLERVQNPQALTQLEEAFRKVHGSCPKIQLEVHTEKTPEAAANSLGWETIEEPLSS